MKLVFVGGAPRSGTTMLGSMLGAHSSCLCIPEAHFKTSVYERMRQKGQDGDLRAAFALIRNDVRFKFWGLKVSPDIPDDIGSYQDLFLYLIRKYSEKVEKPQVLICIDHTPLNIKHADTLFRLFPEAKMIHLVRDGRAVSASVMPLDWGPSTIDKAATSWMKEIRCGFRAESDFGDERVKRVKYEDVVLDAEKTTKDVCAFLDIAYEPAMIAGRGFLLPAYTTGQHHMIGRGPVADRVDAWKNSLTRREVEIFENMAGDYLLRLGYAVLYGATARKVSFPEKVIFMLKHRYRKRLNRFRRGRRVKAGVDGADKVFEEKKI